MDDVDTTDRSAPKLWRLPVLAAGLALVALVLALVSSLAIEQIRTTYTWGFPEAPQEDAEWRPVASTGEFTPFLLAALPFQWDVRWSCRVDRLADAEPLEVFTSVLRDDIDDALRVTLLDDTFEVTAGGEVVTVAPADEAPGCSYQFTLDDEGTWSLVEGGRVLGSGSIDESLRLTGFGSGLGDDGASGSVAVAVTTQRYGATASTGVRLMQIGAIVLGAMTVVTLIVAWRREDRRPSTATREG